MTNSEYSLPEKIFLRLDKGEEIVSSLIKFCHDNDITGAWVSGLGAISKATVAFYDLNNKTYNKQTFDEPFEIASLTGNIAKLDNKTVGHLHIVLANHQMKTIGGHLEEATVAATCEIIIDTFSHPLHRQYKDEIGLNLIK